MKEPNSVSEELYVIGNPMYGRCGGDCYSYRLNEMVDQRNRVIGVGFYNFANGENDVDNRIHTQPENQRYYKLDGHDAFAECVKSDKGRWVFKDVKRYRHYIYLVDTPMTPYFDPSF